MAHGESLAAEQGLVKRPREVGGRVGVVLAPAPRVALAYPTHEARKVVGLPIQADTLAANAPHQGLVSSFTELGSSGRFVAIVVPTIEVPVVGEEQGIDGFARHRSAPTPSTGSGMGCFSRTVRSPESTTRSRASTWVRSRPAKSL